MPDRTPRGLFLSSLNRCQRAEGFASAFYDRFLAADPEIPNKFRHTDFKKQNEMLIQSLRLIGGATTGDSASLRELRERATTHDRHHLNIGASLYAFWKQALLATVRDFDSEIDEETERAWETILDHAIAHMIRSY